MEGETKKHCPRCGAEVAEATSPGGLCPKCLLVIGLGGGPGSPEVIFTGANPAEPPPTIEELAPRFPQLEIGELIGRGGMGAVYKAVQKGLGRTVALKVLPKSAGADPTFAERFAREARALARLSHAGIVGIHDSGVEDGLFYFVMEYIDGANLRQVIRAKTTTPREALSIVAQVCDALQYAHEEGIVHRDIKPENILIDKRGRVKIADFGLAKLLGGERGGYTLTQTHQTMGTPHYMAPEQWEKPQQVDHRADIYSLGVVFYELLTGELPLGHFVPPSHKIQVDLKIDEVVLKTLAKEPERRYQHASEVKTEVQTVAARPDPASAKKRGFFARTFLRFRQAFDPTFPGRKRLFGMDLSSNWLPLGMAGFLWLCAAIGGADCFFWPLAIAGTLVLWSKTRVPGAV
jgi:serine/threonine protein kinase